MFAKKKKREMIRQLQETDHKIDIRMLNKSYQMGAKSRIHGSVDSAF